MIKILLWANTIFEVAVGLVVLLSPRFIFPDIANSGDSVDLMISFARTFGVTSLAIGLLSTLMSLRTLTPEIKFAGMGSLAAFHLGMTLVHLLNVIEGLVPFPLMVIHGVFTLIFFSIFIWNVN